MLCSFFVNARFKPLKSSIGLNKLVASIIAKRETLQFKEGEKKLFKLELIALIADAFERSCN